MPTRKFRRCSQCKANGKADSVTVRMYRKRSQLEFRFTLCEDCLTMLTTILREGADSIQRGFYDPPSVVVTT
jgi:uncharacterized protein with PIN domain